MRRFGNSFYKICRSNRLIAVMAVVAVVLITAVSTKEAMAYFTTYATAQGSLPVTLGPKTEVHENFKDWTKNIQVENTGDVSVYVRVKVIAGSQFTITAKGSNWSAGNDGYWYYSKPVAVGELTESIEAYIKVVADVESSFNIVVVQECTPVEYDENGNAVPAIDSDWAQQAEYVINADELEEKEAE